MGRYVIYGSGAVGGAIGAGLHLAGRDVALIARGAQLEALRDRGLVFETPDRERTLTIPAVASPQELEITGSDVVVLAMKSQDTAAALEALAETGDARPAIVCAQNGVENERLALRHFADVYGMFVWVTAQSLEPGVVQVFSAPSLGILDLGLVPRGVDSRAAEISTDLRAAGFASRAEDEIMRWKYGKLLTNLVNAVEALLGPESPRTEEIMGGARAEAVACYRAAGIDHATESELQERVAGHEELRPIQGATRGGASTWQSLDRRTGRVETLYLNGEIVLLGRLHGVPTPVNETLGELMLEMAREGSGPGSLDPKEFERAFGEVNTGEHP